MLETVSGADHAIDMADFAALHGQGLLRFAFVLTRDPDTAQDVVQTVLERMLVRGSGELHEPLAYARRAVANEIISNQRKHMRRERILGRLRVSGQYDSEEGHVDAKEAIWRALDQLSDRQRVAVVMRYLDDVKVAEIASTLSCSEATVRSLVARALPKLRTLIELGDSE